MKKLFLLLLIVPVLAIAQPRQKPGVTYDAVITRVIDGDTVAFQADFLPAPLKKELSIRVFGVDTPEKDSVPNARVKHSVAKQPRHLPSN